MSDALTKLIDDLEDLHKQATVERSHYYVGGCVRRALAALHGADLYFNMAERARTNLFIERAGVPGAEVPKRSDKDTAP